VASPGVQRHHRQLLLSLELGWLVGLEFCGGNVTCPENTCMSWPALTWHVFRQGDQQTLFFTIQSEIFSLLGSWLVGWFQGGIMMASECMDVMACPQFSAATTLQSRICCVFRHSRCAPTHLAATMCAKFVQNLVVSHLEIRHRELPISFETEGFHILKFPKIIEATSTTDSVGGLDYLVLDRHGLNCQLII
jgi:hypothetical protein